MKISHVLFLKLIFLHSFQSRYLHSRSGQGNLTASGDDDDENDKLSLPQLVAQMDKDFPDKMGKRRVCLKKFKNNFFACPNSPRLQMGVMIYPWMLVKFD